MANEIYDSTWWGNTIDTASSIGTSTEMIQGQFNLTKIGEEKVVNGDFATDSAWAKGSATTISNGEASFNGALSYVYQDILTIGKTYFCSVDVNNWTSGAALSAGSSATGSGTIYSDITRVSNTKTTFTFVAVSATLGIGSRSFSVIGSIDNVSIKEVRASSVEAVKCLADAIHRIGIQNIQN